MSNESTPPPCTAETDGTRDIHMLEAISAHPAAAAALAAIAAGVPPREALAPFLAEMADETAPATPSDSAAPPEPVSEATATAGVPVGSPSFLSGVQPDFWDDAFSF